jgi:hypothetical protein
VEAQVEAAVSAGDRGREDALRTEKAQLRTKEAQLRTKEEQLRAEKAQLLTRQQGARCCARHCALRPLPDAARARRPPRRAR